jgi:hypothetical protein
MSDNKIDDDLRKELDDLEDSDTEKSDLPLEDSDSINTNKTNQSTTLDKYPKYYVKNIKNELEEINFEQIGLKDYYMKENSAEPIIYVKQQILLKEIPKEVTVFQPLSGNSNNSDIGSETSSMQNSNPFMTSSKGTIDDEESLYSREININNKIVFNAFYYKHSEQIKDIRVIKIIDDIFHEIPINSKLIKINQENVFNLQFTSLRYYINNKNNHKSLTFKCKKNKKDEIITIDIPDDFISNQNDIQFSQEIKIDKKILSTQEMNEKLLESLFDYCEYKKKCHWDTSKYYEKMNKIFVFPSIVITTGCSIMAFIASSSYFNPDTNTILALSVGSLGSVSSLIQSLSAAYGFGKKLEAHQLAVESYEELVTKIKFMKIKIDKGEELPQDFLDYIEDTMDGIKQRCKYIIPEWIENMYYEKKLKRHILKKQIQSQMEIVNTKSEHIKQKIDIYKRQSNKKYTNTLARIEDSDVYFDIENQSISDIDFVPIEKQTKRKKTFLSL